MKFFKYALISTALLTVLVGCGDNSNINYSQSGNQQDNTNTIISSEDNSSKYEISMGTWNNNVYSNDFLNIKFNMPEYWTRYTDNEIATTMGVDENIAFGGEEFLSAISEQTSVYYVIANDTNTGNNLSIVSEKSEEEKSIQDYMTQLKSQLDSLEAIKYETGDITTELIGGNEYNVLDVVVSDYGISQRYYVRKIDKYFVGIIITAYEKENIKEIIGRFE